MKRAIKKLRPASGFSHTIHLLFNILLPISLYVLARINLYQLAIALILLSKWRVLAVRPRHWLAYIRANAADLVVGISTVIFMSQSSSQMWQIILAVMYAVWLLLIKPGTSLIGISAQAFIAQVCGLMALYVTWGGSALFILVLGTWAVTYVSARHFFSAFDEPYTRFLSDMWAFFGAGLAWVLGHWLVFYGVVSQVTLLLTVLSFGLGTMYYLSVHDRLTPIVRRQLTFILVAIVVVVIVFSDWSDKAI